MKFLTLILTFLFTSQALAHTDHVLGEGAAHYVYHLIFWIIFAAVIVKAVQLFKKKKVNKNSFNK